MMMGEARKKGPIPATTAFFRPVVVMFIFDGTKIEKKNGEEVNEEKMRKRKREQSCVDCLLCCRFFFFSFATVYLVHLVSYHVTFPVILVLLLSVNAFSDAI